MIQEAYVSFKVAKLLKKKGFNWECRTCYEHGELKTEVCRQYVDWNGRHEVWELMSAPTHQMACAWLREKGYHIYVFMLKDNIWVYEIQKLNEDWTYFFSNFRNYDKAIEAALKYVLKNLI